MRPSKSWTSGLRFLHNGKGRPPVTSLCGLRTRSFASQSSHLLLKRLAPSHNSQPPSLSSRFANRRLASTSTIHKESALAPSPDQATDSWAAAFDDISVPVITHLQHHVGDLKAFGVDFGWGPSTFVQWCLEHVHVYSGLPWFATVVGTVILGRLALLKLNFKAADTAGRLALLKPQTEKLQAKMTAARNSQDQQAMVQATREIKQLYDAANIQPAKIFLPLVIQIPIGFAFWRVTRRMAEIPIPGLDSAGFAWLTDLTVPDPNLILPLLTSASMYLVFKRGGEMGTAAPGSGTMMAVMKYGLPTLSFIAMYWQPAITQLVFFTTSIWAIGQSYILSSNELRRRLGICPLPPSNAGKAEVPKAYRGTITMHQTASGSYSTDGKIRKHDAPDAFTPMKKQWQKVKESMNKKMTERADQQEKERASEYEIRRKAEIKRTKNARSSPQK